MNVIHYIGLDVHKKTISYCIKTAAGQILQESTLVAERSVLRSWAASLPQPWHGAMEATIFSAWIYDTLRPNAERREAFCVVSKTVTSVNPASRSNRSFSPGGLNR
jgi:hypothetical protein